MLPQRISLATVHKHGGAWHVAATKDFHANYNAAHAPSLDDPHYFERALCMPPCPSPPLTADGVLTWGAVVCILVFRCWGTSG